MELRVLMHGEAIFYEEQLTKVNLQNCKSIYDIEEFENLCHEGRLIVANSETTGNHHVLELTGSPEISFARASLELLYIKNDVPLKVECVLPSRHGTVTLPVPQEDCVWVKTIAQETDHMENIRRQVAD